MSTKEKAGKLTGAINNFKVALDKFVVAAEIERTTDERKEFVKSCYDEWEKLSERYKDLTQSLLDLQEEVIGSRYPDMLKWKPKSPPV